MVEEKPILAQALSTIKYIYIYIYICMCVCVCVWNKIERVVLQRLSFCPVSRVWQQFFSGWLKYYQLISFSFIQCSAKNHEILLPLIEKKFYLLSNKNVIYVRNVKAESLFLSFSLSLSLYIYIYIYICMQMQLFVYLSIYLSIYLREIIMEKIGK